MIVFEAAPVLALAVAVWVLWRMVTWRRTGGDVTREVVIAVLFAWSLIVVNYTFFPLNIIFYDWHGRFSLIPFASIIQLVRDTSVTTAFYNIAGNLFLLAPLGILLPLLFKQLRRPWSLIWRVAVVSASIEIVQLMTNARAVDVDDVILNTTGAALAYGLFWVLTRLSQRSGRASELLERVGASTNREPLLLPAVPILLTAAIAVPIMVSMIVAATLGDGPSGILGHATADWPGSTVVARADIDQHAFLVIRDDADGSERLGIAGYK
ncbi:MAG: VanZ family protein, partial [Thermoanaerobaculales bacterium]|nr:VanZ family protein [Thermoanaerobaculales bacterium]